MRFCHQEPDLLARGFRPLPIPGKETMPGFGALRRLSIQYDIAWPGLTAFRVESGLWKFYLRPEAVSGFVDEPMFPKGGL